MITGCGGIIISTPPPTSLEEGGGGERAFTILQKEEGVEELFVKVRTS